MTGLVNKQWNGKDVEGSNPDLVWGTVIFPAFFLEGLRENIKAVIRDDLSPDPELNKRSLPKTKD